jgi:hypothetical protein
MRKEVDTADLILVHSLDIYLEEKKGQLVSRLISVPNTVHVQNLWNQLASDGRAYVWVWEEGDNSCCNGDEHLF